MPASLSKSSLVRAEARTSDLYRFSGLLTTTLRAEVRPLIHGVDEVEERVGRIKPRLVGSR